MRRAPVIVALVLTGLAGGAALPGEARAGALDGDGQPPAPPAAAPAQDAPPAAPAQDAPPAPPAEPAAPVAPAAPAADEPRKTEPAAKAPEPKKAEEKKEPETPVTGTLFSVRLKTGRTVRGVVHRVGLWERRDRDSGWVEAKREDAGAGLRLWYPSLLDGFLFVAARDIEQLEDLGALSAEEGLRITRERSVAATRAETERTRLKAEAEERAARESAAAAAREEVESARKEAAAKGAGPRPGPSAAGAMVPLDRAKRFAELLEKYPPTVWHPDTPKEIERRRLILDLFPTDEEKDFLSVYAEWREAYEFWKKSEDAAGADEAAGAAASVKAPAR